MKLTNDTETEQLSIDKQTFDDLNPTDDTLLRFNRRYVGEYVGRRSILHGANIWYFSAVSGARVVVIQRDEGYFIDTSFESSSPWMDYSAATIPLEHFEVIKTGQRFILY